MNDSAWGESVLARSYLFVPANRPDRFGKAASAGADIVVLDLEDSVPGPDKSRARDHARSWLVAGNRAVVRVNAIDTSWHADDVRMAASNAAIIMLPKADDADALAHVASLAPDTPVIALIETPAGILAAANICRFRTVLRVAFGSIDFAAQTGVDPDDRDALLFARSTLVTASAAAGLVPPIDGVTTSISDPHRLSDDTRHGKRVGMSAKLCIHPNQVDTVHAALAPSPHEVMWAQRILDSTGNHDAAMAVDGAMVDLPVLTRARQILKSNERR